MRIFHFGHDDTNHKNMEKAGDLFNNLMYITYT